MKKYLSLILILTFSILKAQSKLSIHVGGFTNLITTTKTTNLVFPQLSLAYNDRIEIGGVILKTSRKYHPELFKLTDYNNSHPNSDNIFNAYMKIYLGIDRKFSFSFGVYGKFKASDHKGLISDYRETTLGPDGLPLIELTNEIEHFPLVDDLTIGFIGVDYHFSIYENLYIIPQIQFRNVVRNELIYIQDIGSPSNLESLNNKYYLRKVNNKQFDLSLNVSIMYKIGLIR